jgi:Domain of unknown function (DUF4350)
MRERLLTLALALAALLVFLALFVHAGGPPGAEESVPTSVDRGDDGLRGALTWLSEEGVRTRALRQRFTSVAQLSDLPARGNLLILTLPAAVPFHSDEARALDDWLRRGNTLLVLATLADRPLWSRDRGVLGGDLHLITGLEVATQPAPRAAARGKRTTAPTPVKLMTAPSKPQRALLVPGRSQRYLEGVAGLAGFSDLSPPHWQVKLPRGDFPLCLAHVGTSPDCGLWLLEDDAGSILLSGFGSLLSNRALGEADNARFLANLASASLGPGGMVLFDDEHQGLSDSYDPDKFYRDRRLYQTLAVLAAVWLVWVVGGTRLAPPAGPPPAQGEADLVRTTGAFLARVLRPAAAARRMYEHFFQRLRRTLREPTLDPSPYWEWLENNPRLKRADVAQLRSWYSDAYSDRRVPLTRLHNLIVHTEMQIAA